MPTNFFKSGRTLTVTLGATVATGAGLLQGAAFGILTRGGGSGDVREIWFGPGVVGLPKTAAQTFTVGAVVYWDNTAKSVTAVKASNYRIGVANKAAAGGDATAEVRLDGVSVVQEAP